MVQFQVEKKNLLEATTLIAQVSNLKSRGATPAENSSLCIFPNSISIMNNNEANGILVENIPIKIFGGDVATHLDHVSMINTKKLASIVKGCKDNVNFMVTENTVSVGEGRRKFELSIYVIEKQSAPEVRLLNHSINIKDVVKNLSDSGLITENAINLENMSGTLFAGNDMIASDRVSAIYIKKAGIFNSVPEMEDIVLDTDLFSSCLSKTSEETAVPGFTTNGQRMVLRFGNTTLYKTMLFSKFPKDKLLSIINSTEKEMSLGIKAIIPLKEFTEKLKEIREIVESDEYVLAYGKEGILALSNKNEKIGTDGEVSMDIDVSIPETAGNLVKANFTYKHLEMFSKIFSDSDTIEVFSAMGTHGNIQLLRYLAATSGNKLFFCTPII